MIIYCYCTVLPCDAMHKRDLHCCAVPVCPAVYRISSNVFTFGSYTILVFLYQSLWQYSDETPPPPIGSLNAGV